MNDVLNFVKSEVSGTSREEAFKNLPFNIEGDATPAFKRWCKNQEVEITEQMITEFMQTYLERKTRQAPGVGFFITVTPAVPNTREHPFKFNDITSAGKRDYGHCYLLIDADTNKILAQVNGTRANAKIKAKEIIRDGFHGKLNCVHAKMVSSDNATAFTAEYAESKGAHIGTWKVFGIRTQEIG